MLECPDGKLAGLFMRYILDHWPEFAFMALVMAPPLVAMFAKSVLLLLVGWPLGVAIFVAAIFLSSRRRDKNSN